MSIRSVILLISPILLLQGCQNMGEREMIIRNRANDYLRTSLIEPIKIPEGLSYSRQAQLYPLPDVIPEGSVEQASVVPPGFGKL